MKKPIANLISGMKAAAKRGAKDFKLEANGKAIMVSWQPKRGFRKAHMITVSVLEAATATELVTKHVHTLNNAARG